jgi:excisionase family DNA binding protein
MVKLLNSLEVAEMLGESRDYVYTLARQGILPSVKLGRKVKFSEQALLEFIDKGGQAYAGNGWRKEA